MCQNKELFQTCLAFINMYSSHESKIFYSLFLTFHIPNYDFLYFFGNFFPNPSTKPLLDIESTFLNTAQAQSIDKVLNITPLHYSKGILILCNGSH